MGFATFDERQAGNWQVTFDDTTYPTASPLTALDVRAIRFDTILATNNDIVDHAIGVYMDFGSGAVHFAQFNIPAGSGEPGLGSVDVLAAILPLTSPGIVLEVGAIMGLAQYDALGSGKKIRVLAIGGYI